MLRTMMKSKIHRATVTQADLHYVGSVTVDEDLLDAADLLAGELVHIVDVTNGARLETYTIAGERGSGVIGINGAAAHLVHPGDVVILIAYGQVEDAEAKARTLPPRTDIELETLAEIMEGTRLVHCHSYRQDEIVMLLRTAERFGFRVATLQHVLEGYKVAPEIAAHGAGASSFSDWWAYKIEVMDAIPWNGAMLHRAGVLVSFNSDSDELARRMNMEAAKAVRYGGLSPEEALKLVTLNPAKQLRVDHRVGSLEVGKDADFAIWNGEPLSAFTRCEQTWIDGVRRYSRSEESELHPKVAKARAELIAKATADTGGAGAGGGPGGGMGAGMGGGRGGRGGRGRPPTLLERMIEAREDYIWLRIARGLDPIPSKQGDCGCGAVNAQQAMPAESETE